MKKIRLIGIALVLTMTLSFLYWRSTLPKSNKVTVVYQSQRGGAYEPCGCHSYPYGGLDREANALESFRKDNPQLLYVDAGNMLIPLPEDRKSSLERFKPKTKFLVETLSEMGLDAFSPGPGDYELDLSTLRQLERQSRFKWISTNVVDSTGKPAFEPYTILRRGPYRFAILSATPKVPFGGATSLKGEDPIASLERWVPELKKKAHFVILLSQLSLAENQAIVQNPESGIQLVVGAEKGLSFEDALWYAQGKSLMVDPEYYGYTVGKLDLEIQLPFTGFYSFSTIQKNRERLAQLQTDVRTLGKNDPDAEKRLEDFRSRNSFDPIVGGIQYKNTIIKLDEIGFGKHNSIKDRLESMKRDTREKALAE